jgi:MFS family permease
VSRWFDRRRGTAVALISSGQYIAGVVWPAAFQFMIGRTGWRLTMLVYAAVVVAIILPVAAVSLHPPPVPRVVVAPSRHRGRDRARVLGLPANVVQTLICVAGFCCCVPMAIPSSHLVAYCSDLGIGAESGAAMLSLLLGCAFISRQFWGVIADRYGGLWTVLAGSACQAIAIAAFLLTQNEAALYAIAAAYGLGFSGIIPAYVVAIRELFPAAEASWRIPLVLFISMGGMAFGSWFAGSIYDRFGHYGPAFGVGVLFNLANLMLIGFLLARQPSDRGRLATA